MAAITKKKAKKKATKRGKLIVLDGADGAGKATQTKLLLARLQKEKVKVQTMDFPRYEQNLFGKLIGECLAGKHGDFVGMSPYVASVLYAADRFESKQQIEKWLAAGYTVVLDRYVSANQIHQGGKILDTKERRRFLAWLEQMEFGVFGLPKPECIVYLDVPYEISQQLLQGTSATSRKTYMKKGILDQAESSEEYLKKSRESALKMVKASNQWERIVCVNRQGELLPREDIHERIWLTVQNYI
jgi:dTMP kinase